MKYDYIGIGPVSELDSCKIFDINPNFLTPPNLLKLGLPGWDLEFCIKNKKPFSGDSECLVHTSFGKHHSNKCMHGGQYINKKVVLSQSPASSKFLLQHL